MGLLWSTNSWNCCSYSWPMLVAAVGTVLSVTTMDAGWATMGSEEGGGEIRFATNPSRSAKPAQDFLPPAECSQRERSIFERSPGFRFLSANHTPVDEICQRKVAIVGMATGSSHGGDNLRFFARGRAGGVSGKGRGPGIA